MQKVKVFVAVGCLAALVVWLGFSQRYTVTTAPDGTMVRVNRMTGETTQIVGDTLVPVRTTEEQHQEEVRKEQQSTARELPPCPIPTMPEKQAHMKIKSGPLGLRFRLVFPKGTDFSGLSSVQLVFKDADEFMVTKTYLELHQPIERTDEGEVYEGTVSLNVPLSKIDTITSWQFATSP